MKAGLCLALVVLTGCATARLTPAGESVRVTANPEAVRGCELLGEVSGEDRVNGGMLGQGAAEENALVRLRNAAAELGADVVLMVMGTTNMSGSSQRGEAYSCR